MKIIVVHKNGDKEVLTLTEPIKVSRGKGLNRLSTSTGTDHFFDQEGYYDGWGGAFNGTADEATDFIDAMEKDREIIP